MAAAKQTMKLEWQDSYRTGETEIDSQHRALFEDVAKVLAAQDRDELLHCTLELVRNTQAHFVYEEKVMRRIVYPEINSHFKQHTDLMSKVTSFSERVANGAVNNADVEEFIIGWLLDHIKSSDAKLATYIWSLYPNWTDSLLK
jgi:hemerythrin